MLLNDLNGRNPPPSPLSHNDFNGSVISFPSSLLYNDVNGRNPPPSSLSYNDVNGRNPPPSSLFYNDINGNNPPPSSIFYNDINGNNPPPSSIFYNDINGVNPPPSSILYNDVNTNISVPSFSFYNYDDRRIPPPFDADHGLDFTDWMRLVLLLIGPMVVCGFGVVSNVVNLTVFHRQGVMSDSCTTSLTFLAASDLCLCLLNFSASIGEIPCQMASIDGRFEDSLHLAKITIEIRRPDRLFVKWTSWITVFVALERMVCVTFPFHVKLIFNPRRSCVVICTMFVLFLTTDFPYLMYWKYSHLDIIKNLAGISEGLSDFYFRFPSIAIILVLNIIIIGNVIRAKRFRKRTRLTGRDKSSITTPVAPDEKVEPGNGSGGRSNDDDQGRKTGNKELKLVVMVTVLSVMYLICYSITGVFAVAIRMALVGIQWLATMENVGRLLEGLNSSCNIVIYYTMSTKYKTELRRICKCLGDKL